ncbi:MAG: carboxypeptidase-like regulatory domain-containing protein [Planctomycetota bacterium]
MLRLLALILTTLAVVGGLWLIATHGHNRDNRVQVVRSTTVDVAEPPALTSQPPRESLSMPQLRGRLSRERQPEVMPPVGLPDPRFARPLGPAVHFVVRDSEGRPIQNANVDVRDSPLPVDDNLWTATSGTRPYGRKITDEEGCAGVEAGLHGLLWATAWASGYSSEQKRVRWEGTDHTVELVLRRRGSVSLRIAYPDGSAADDVELIAWRAYVDHDDSVRTLGGSAGRRTDESGLVTWSDLVTDEPITFKTFWDERLNYLIEPLQPGEHRDLGVIEVPRGRVLAGEVLDRDGFALRGVRVSVHGDDGTRKWRWADDQGRFRFRVSWKVAYTVSAAKRGFADSVSVSPPKSDDRLDLVLHREPHDSHRILVLSPDGSPATGARVSVGSPGHESIESRRFASAEVDQEGWCWLLIPERITHGPIEFVATLGCRYYSTSVAHVHDLPSYVSMPRGADLRVTLVMSDGSPVPEVGTTLRADRPYPVQRCGWGEVRTWEGLRAGWYELKLWAGEIRDTRISVELVDREVRTVELTLDRKVERSTLLRIKDTSYQPITKARVTTVDEFGVVSRRPAIVVNGEASVSVRDGDKLLVSAPGLGRASVNHSGSGTHRPGRQHR